VGFSLLIYIKNFVFSALPTTFGLCAVADLKDFLFPFRSLLSKNLYFMSITAAAIAYEPLVVGWAFFSYYYVYFSNLRIIFY